MEQQFSLTIRISQIEKEEFLDALERQHKENSQQKADAISFASYNNSRKEDPDHV